MNNFLAHKILPIRRTIKNGCATFVWHFPLYCNRMISIKNMLYLFSIYRSNKTLKCHCASRMVTVIFIIYRNKLFTYEFCWPSSSSSLSIGEELTSQMSPFSLAHSKDAWDEQSDIVYLYFSFVNLRPLFVYLFRNLRLIRTHAKNKHWMWHLDADRFIINWLFWYLFAMYCELNCFLMNCLYDVKINNPWIYIYFNSAWN